MDEFSFTNNTTTHEADKMMNELNNRVIIRFKARNARKGITSIEGLYLFDVTEDQLVDFSKQLKKKFACASYVNKETLVIELQGNHVFDIVELIEKQFNISAKKINVQN